MEDLLSFSLSGVYSLLLLSLTFSFLLGIRIRQLETRFISSESQISAALEGINSRITHIEDSMR